MKRYGMVMAMLLALPAMANAWYLNAKSANTTQGTVTPSGTKYVATGASSAEYVVTPKTTAYKIKKVTLDGAELAPNANGNYVAPYDAAKAYRYLVAYFTANTVYYNITTTAGANGAVYEDTYESLANIPAGASRQILVVPNTGYSIADLTVSAGGVVTDTANGKLVTFDSLAADQSVAATFALTPVVTIDPIAPVTLNMPGAGYAKSLFANAASNQGAITYAWSNKAPATALQFGTPAAANTTVYTATAAGTFTAVLTATSGSTVVTQEVPVTVLDGKAMYLNQCASCHNNNNPDLVANYTAGAHGTASGHNTGTCQRCHATEGAIAGFQAGWTGSYADVYGNTAVKDAIWTPVQPAISANGVACAVCHNTDHDGLRAVNAYVGGSVVAWDPNANAKVDQYDVCTACHTITDNAGAVIGNYHNGGSINIARTITDSHGVDDVATTFGAATNRVEGYVVRTNSATPCADCHNLHKADVAMQEEWAESGHAGKIAVNKKQAVYDYATAQGLLEVPPVTPETTGPWGYGGKTITYLEKIEGTVGAIDAAKAAGVTETSGAAWVHYNWDQTSSRGTCQKCHTATGASNYLSNPAAYSPANNDFSHLAGWNATTGSAQNELLYCWGCHSDTQTGALRNPGAIKADYKFQGATAVYPDVQASNTCLACHIGQASGNSITDLSAAGNTFTNQGFVNSHYMAAGSLMYVKGGYTNFVPAQTALGTVSYGQTLTSPDDMTVDINGAPVAGSLTSTHRKLGTAAIIGVRGITAEMGLDSNGPCVTCHYADDHILELGQGALDAVCSKCHADAGTTVESLHLFIEEEGAAPFQAALDLALSKLAANYNITYNQSAYPYFYDVSAANGAVKNWTRSNFLTTGLSAADAEKLMGAAFNINLLKRDPAAHAHARTYARRLLYDTIDFLDDGVINLSTGATALASGIKDAQGNDVFVKGDTALSANTTEAYKYLVGYDRTSGVWNTIERP